MLAGTPIDSAIGVLQVTLHDAHGLKSVNIGGGTPDPYVTFSIGARLGLDRSKVSGSLLCVGVRTNPESGSG